MKETIFSLLILTIIGFASCEKACKQTINESISDVTLLDTMSLGDQQDIGIKYSFGDCSGDETHTLVVEKIADFNYEVKMEVLYTGCTCTFILVNGEKTYNFAPEEAGTYIFEFWENDTERLSKTIVVQ